MQTVSESQSPVIALRVVMEMCFVGLAVFVPTGTLDWPRGWVLVAVLLVLRTATAFLLYDRDPVLARQRARLPLHSGQPGSDKILVLFVMVTGFVALPAIASFDVHHLHIFPAPPTAVSTFGLIMFVAGWSLKALALVTNTFAAGEVRVHRERSHVPVDRGAYKIVRHPFYLGSILVFAGIGLWLGSWLAFLLAVVPAAGVIIRLGLEEQFLRRELPGYAEYAERVRFRIVPGLW